MPSHSHQHATRCSLAQHQRGREEKDQQYGIARLDVLESNPRLDHRLAKYNKNGSDWKNDEGTKSVSGNEDFSQTIHIAESIRVAGHWNKDLRKAFNDFAGIVDNSRTDIEVGDRGGREESADYDGIRFETKSRRDDHD